MNTILRTILLSIVIFLSACEANISKGKEFHDKIDSLVTIINKHEQIINEHEKVIEELQEENYLALKYIEGVVSRTNECLPDCKIP